MNSKKSKAIGICFVFLALAVLGIAAGLAMGQYLQHHPEPVVHLAGWKYILLLAGLLAGMFLSVLVHESGHLIMGLLTGYRFLSFRICSFMFVRKEGKVRCKRFSMAGTGGQCLMAPPDMVDEKIPYVFYNAGGFLLNLLAAVVFLAISILSLRIPPVFAFFALLSITEAATALLNGIPMRAGEIDNDGKNICSLKGSESAKRCFWIQLKVNEMLTGEIPIREMPKEWFAIPNKEDLQNPLCTAVGVLACNRAMDQMNFARAQSIANYLLKEVKEIFGVYRCILLNDMLYCELIGENKEAEAARIYGDKELQTYWKASPNNISVLRTRYAYEVLHRKDFTAAGKYLDMFEKVAEVYPHEVEVQRERELIVRV